MDYGTHLIYHKHANCVAIPINYPLPVHTKGEVVAVLIIIIMYS